MPPASWGVPGTAWQTPVHQSPSGSMALPARVGNRVKVGTSHFAGYSSTSMASTRLDILKSMVEQNPGDSFARYGLAMEYRNTGDLEAAMARVPRPDGRQSRLRARLLSRRPDPGTHGPASRRPAKSICKASKSPPVAATSTPEAKCRVPWTCSGRISRFPKVFRLPCRSVTRNAGGPDLRFPDVLADTVIWRESCRCPPKPSPFSPPTLDFKYP